jgi:CDP-glycerol glycerophosphotransferase (TagB/SpsB family)
MKDYIKKSVKNYILDHEISSITTNEQNDLVITFKQLKPILGKRFLVLKDRDTGRRLRKTITGNKISIALQEILEITEEGTLDIYLRSYPFNTKLSRRSPFNNQIQSFELIDKEKKSKIKLFKTKNNNVSLLVQKSSFAHNLSEIKVIGKNFYLSGNIEAFEDNLIPAVVEMIAVRRDTKQAYGYRFELETLKQKNTYKFSGILFLDKLRNSLVLNSRWDLFIQLRDENQTIIYKELVNAQGYKRYDREEQRYLVNCMDRDECLAALYATAGKESLAIWYTDEAQFQKTYNIAKGKSIFNETCEQEDIDEKMVFFESFLGKSYSGNPKYIYEEILKHDKFKNYKFVWSYSNDGEIPGNPIVVDRESEDYYRYLAKSKYWVSNVIFPVHRKREGNVYLQTWHGTPLKKLGFDIEVEGPETLGRENFYIESRNWDYLIAANPYSAEIFKRAFKFHKEVLEVGYPANDIFYREDVTQFSEQIKRKLNIPKNKKVILYAPTWRDNEASGSWEHSFSLKFDLDEYYEKLKDDYILILRMHHLIADSLQIKEEHKSFVMDLSKYDDVQELYTIADILITDYSSVFFDYANSKKPILFYAYDFEVYKNEIRGFYLDMETELPGPVIKTGKELLEAIQNIDQVSKEYKERYEEFYNRFCGLEDGNAAKRVLDRVFH